MAADGGRLALGGHACQFKLSEMNDRRRRQQRLAILKPIAVQYIQLVMMIFKFFTSSI